MTKLIYSQEDLDLILSLEIQTNDEEIERLNKALDEATKIINLKQKEIVRLSNNNRNTREYIKYSLNNPMCYERKALNHSLELLERSEDNE